MKHNPFSFITAPYPLFKERQYWLIFAVLSGIFISSFLIFFKPFGIIETTNLAYLCGYGFITFACIVFTGIVLPMLLPNVFVEERWTVIKQVVWLSSIILLVAFFNNFYANWYYQRPVSIYSYIDFIRMVLSLGVFVLSGLTIADYIRRLKMYQNYSQELNQQIHSNIQKISDSVLELSDENQKDKIKVAANDLVFIKADDNYVEIHYQQQNQIKKIVFRNTLKSIETATEDYLFRCHRTYLVNLKKVSKISGNAQGYRLHFDNSENVVPVSREKGREIKDAIRHLQA